MTQLALASLRRRGGGPVASFLSVFLGTAIVVAFGSMLDTGLRPGTPGGDRTTLLIIATVVGGWGALIVASAVATTVAVTARQRSRELALLRSAGATPDQVTALITREMAVVAGLGSLLALPLGYGGGRVLLLALQATHQVSQRTHFAFGAAAVAIGLAVGMVVAVAATRITARRAARRRVVDALFDAAAGGRRMGRRRFWAGLICLGFGIESVVMSQTMVSGKDVYDVQMIASEACIFAGIGFALLAPLLLGWAIRLLGPALRAVSGVSGVLALAGIRQRIQQAATPLMPIIVVTSIATGTLYMQAITNSLHARADDKSVDMLNYVIVAMISVFAAVMLVNLLAATLSDRRQEFAQQRLVGATPRQVLAMVGAEDGLLLVVGLAFGTVGALLTVVPFSIKTTHRVIPNASIGIYLAVVAVVAGLTVGTSLLATWRATRTDAIGELHEAAWQ